MPRPLAERARARADRRTRRPPGRWVPLMLLAPLVFVPAGCFGDPSDPWRPDPAPALEVVAFEALDGARILFERIGDDGDYSAVYLIDAAAAESRPVLDTVSGVVFGPALSPDGGRVAWLRWTDFTTAYDVYVTDLAGAGARRLSSFGGNIEGPAAWSPAGDAVLYPAMLGLASGGIYRVDPVTGHDALWHEIELGPEGEFRCPAFSSTWDAIAVSAAGALAWACDGALYATVDPALQATPVLEAASPASALHGAAWSPAGDEIALVEVLHDGEPGSSPITSTHVRVVDHATGAVRTIAEIEGSGTVHWATRNAFSVCWLPAGDRVVFNAAATGVTGDAPLRASLYVVGADGTGLVRLTTAEAAFDHSVSCAS